MFWTLLTADTLGNGDLAGSHPLTESYKVSIYYTTIDVIASEMRD